jgi:hypothetical protein
MSFAGELGLGPFFAAAFVRLGVALFVSDNRLGD